MKKRILCILLAGMLLAGCESVTSGSSSSKGQENSASANSGDSASEEETSGSQDTESDADSPEESDSKPEVSSDNSGAEFPDTTAAETDLADSQYLFDIVLVCAETQIYDDRIVESGQVNGQKYSLTIDLQKWDHYTTVDQMIHLSELFWECYPKMYERYADLTSPPTDIILAIEDEGYGIAEAGGNFIHLHDQWLYDNDGDYDCITHELAHIIQNGWDGDYLEYSSYIERFADCCRYEYAMKDGAYNDTVWTLQTAYDEDTRESSVRFLVWLDQFYSGSKDILRSYFDVCRNESYPADEWDTAWQEIFSGTELEGMSIDEVWDMYISSDFAYLSSESYDGEKSELLSKYDIRGRLNG